jgi:hypothetical protein
MARAAIMAPPRERDLRIVRITGPVWTGIAAALLAWCLYVFGPPGGDAATHLYQEHLLRQNGMQFWDNLWYSGRYSLINYTLLYYPLAILVTPAIVVAAAVGVAVAAFTRLVRTAWGEIATPSVIAATLVVPLQVVAGVYPFILGLAVGLAMLVALQSGRVWLATILAVATLLSHVLAFGFVLMVLIAWVAADRSLLRERRGRIFAVVLACCIAGQLLLIRAFSLPSGRYMFDPKDLAAILIFSDVGVALCYGLPAMRGLMMFFGLYGLAALVDFSIPNAVGGNIVRLTALAGLPLILLPVAARRFRPGWIAGVAIAAIALWQGVSPVTEWTASAAAPGQNAAYWTPVLSFLDRHADPDYRVEAVQSKRYWEAYFVAGHGYALARGWYRQDDYPGNAVLYNSPTPASYRAWLRTAGVRYVILSDATLDPSSRAEASLLRSGMSGLVVVAHTGPWTIYALPDPTPIVTPPTAATVTGVTPTSLTLRVRRVVPLTVRVHDTPYWTVGGGAAGCVATGTGSTTTVVPARSGTLVLRFTIRPSSIIRAVLGTGTTCGAPGS